ncbi:DUF1835 domain-containing protein [Bacillus sp. NPDC077027]|uniref:DUF1835 domain-containing protein n=1 Tax=Bacillus sp. NPDC077027 TaxID=3390548 RepID=UPI003CFE47B9
MIHILFGASPAGCFQMTLKKMKRHQKEQIIAFDDIYSIGPLWQLHEASGRKKRVEWLKQVVTNEFYQFDDMVEMEDKAREQVRAISGGEKIIIWTCDSAHEQIGLRYALYLLKGKDVEITIINTSEAYEQLLQVERSRFTPRNSSEISHEIFQHIYEKWPHTTLTGDERRKFENEWVPFAQEHHTLRIWRSGEIISVSEDEFDGFIIKMAKNIQSTQKPDEFMVATRLIGEVIGRLEQYVSDEFLQYRLRQLINQGAFDMKGRLTSMRYYHIKLTEHAENQNEYVCCSTFEKEKSLRIEGDYGADPFWCGHCGCNLEVEDFPVSDALYQELFSWAMAYGRWFDEETDELLPSGVELEDEYNQSGVLLTEKVRSELGSTYHVEYAPSVTAKHIAKHLSKEQ